MVEGGFEIIGHLLEDDIVADPLAPVESLHKQRNTLARRLRILHSQALIIASSIILICLILYAYPLMHHGFRFFMLFVLFLYFNYHAFRLQIHKSIADFYCNRRQNRNSAEPVIRRRRRKIPVKIALEHQHKEQVLTWEVLEEEAELVEEVLLEKNSYSFQTPCFCKKKSYWLESAKLCSGALTGSPCRWYLS